MSLTIDLSPEAEAKIKLERETRRNFPDGFCAAPDRKRAAAGSRAVRNRFGNRRRRGGADALGTSS